MIENNFIFLDSASTTKPKFFRSDYKDLWFNSNMSYAIEEKQKLVEARETIKDCLGVKGGIVLFLRNATDCAKWLSNHFDFNTVYVSPFEHSSVWDSWGHKDVSYSPLAYAHQYVNQMTGTIFSIESFGIEERNKGKYFVSDFTAAIGHASIPDNLETFCDSVWFSPHKFHAEKNIGVLWLGERLCSLAKPSKSATNQFNLVHGTEDVAGALMVADAMESACSNLQNKMDEWKMLADILLRDLNEYRIKCHYVAKDGFKRTYAINALQFDEINADGLATYLASKKIYVGVGHSACADNDDFRVLNAFGLTNEEASKVIRVSFDERTTIHDIKGLVSGIVDFYNMFVKE